MFCKVYNFCWYNKCLCDHNIHSEKAVVLAHSYVEWLVESLLRQRDFCLCIHREDSSSFMCENQGGPAPSFLVLPTPQILLSHSCHDSDNLQFLWGWSVIDWLPLTSVVTGLLSPFPPLFINPPMSLLCHQSLPHSFLHHQLLFHHQLIPVIIPTFSTSPHW